MKASPWVWLTLLTACGLPSGTPELLDTADGGPANVAPDDDPFFASLPQGQAQMAAHCAGGDTDLVSTKFCATPAPVIHGLADLQAMLGLSFAVTTASGGNGTGGNPSFALTANSSSLVAQSVSAINPRAIVFATIPGAVVNGKLPSYVFMTFTRGEQIVELADYDASANNGAGALAFYLVRFTQACNATHSCTYGDLLTPAIEKNWTSATLYEDDEIGNTVFDCLQCHQQAGGPTAPRFLRMQERADPWTHFFKAGRPGAALLADFHAAHGTTEDYGPIPAALIDKSDPSLMSAFLDTYSFAAQPNPFNTAQIEAEVVASAPAQPAVNVPPGVSATWQAAFLSSVMGNAIAPPYHDTKITDPTKLAAMTEAYVAVMAGRAPLASMPDIRDVIADWARSDLSFQPTPTQTVTDWIIQACQHCHDDNVDPTLTRARFNMAHLSELTQDERNLAVFRVGLPESDPLHMPPVRVYRFSADQLKMAASEISDP